MWESRTLQERYLIYFIFPFSCLMLLTATLPVFGRWETPLPSSNWWMHVFSGGSTSEGAVTLPDGSSGGADGSATTPVVPVQPQTADKPLPLYGHLPLWHQILSGAGGVPSAVEVPGDVAFINGVVDTTIATMPVSVSISNSSELRAAYSSCLIPLRLWSTVDGGVHWTDVTDQYLNGQSATSKSHPFYLSCSGPPLTFSVPVVASYLQQDSKLHYEVTVDAGGNFATASGAHIAPKFSFVASSAPA